MPRLDAFANKRHDCKDCGGVITLDISFKEHYNQVHQAQCGLKFQGESGKTQVVRGADGLWRCPKCGKEFEGSCRKIQAHARFGLCKTHEQKMHSVTIQRAAPEKPKVTNVVGTRSRIAGEEDGSDSDDDRPLVLRKVGVAKVKKADLAVTAKPADTKPSSKMPTIKLPSATIPPSPVTAAAAIVSLPAKRRSPSPAPSHPPAEPEAVKSPFKRAAPLFTRVAGRKATAKKPRFSPEPMDVDDDAPLKVSPVLPAKSPTKAKTMQQPAPKVPQQPPSKVSKQPPSKASVPPTVEKRAALPSEDAPVPTTNPTVPAALAAFFATTRVPLVHLAPTFVKHGIVTEETLDLLCTTPAEGNWEDMKAEILAQGLLAGWLAVKRALGQRAELLQKK